MTTGIEYAPGQKALMLEEYLGQSSEAWFATAKTSRTMRAMMVSKETSFRNEMESASYTVQDDGVTVILKGSYDEMLATKLPHVISAYTKPDGREISAGDFAVRDRFIDIVTRTDPGLYFAMRIPPEISVTVVTAWGDVLHSNLPNLPHGNGDYLVCRAGGNGEPDTSDVWIVSGTVFPEYYQKGE